MGFLGDNGYHEEKKLKSGTFFSLYGKIWGYDITVFNKYKEEEILLEPERKFRVENVIPDANGIINVTCEIIDCPIVLDDLKKGNDNGNSNFKYSPYCSQIRAQIDPQMLQQRKKHLEDSEKVLNILRSIISQIEVYSFRYEKVKAENSSITIANCKLYQNLSKSEFFAILEDNINSFEKEFIEFIKKYYKFDFPKNFSKESTLNNLDFFSKILKEMKIKKMISRIFRIIQK